MEQWEQEYIDIVTKSKRTKERGIVVDCSYEEGYDSSRWVEITLPDGKKHYVPKDSIGNRSRKRKRGNHYQAYNDACWREVERENVGFSFRKKSSQMRYYSEKVSFFRTVLKTIRRLVSLLVITVLLFALTSDKPEVQYNLTIVYVLVSLGVIVHAIYFILRCLFEGNLRL